ncbi:hypothetical protein GGQ80_001485 [Sphingomonas jinjuensis]|uniref:HTH domain-containing protein n=1 Tax=Sphingomonas jinjuensis TaxID=535907 RepID=A0A840F2K9_9SPHN|nr:hypothetical protein [Sphingomonas jinjuensis]MBB4153583.1 hypothetical protein [Sphingomonas jinjuensis]
MSIGPWNTVKSLKGFALPAFKAAREQWHVRGAAAGDAPDPATVDRELESALDVLTGDAATLASRVVQLAKSALSDPPVALGDEPVREWLRHPAVRARLKRAAFALVVGAGEDGGDRREATAAYAAATGDGEWYGEAMFDQAVAFLAFTVDAKLPTHARLGIQVTNARADRIEEQVRDVGARLDGQPEILRNLIRTEGAALARVPVDVIGDHLQREVELETAARSIDDPARLGRVTALAKRARNGDLASAPREARIAAVRLAAQLLARAERPDEADELIAAAEAIGASDLATDRARVALVRKDWTTAIALLDRRSDRTSVGMILEAIAGRDGRERALEVQPGHAPATSLGGFMLPMVSTWLAEAGRWEDAEAILDAADGEHVAENPVLLFHRARLRITLMVPEGRREGMLENAGQFPRTNHLRDDPEGERLRTAALADLEALKAMAPRLRAPEFMETVEATRAYLALGSADASIRETTRVELLGRLADPATALDVAWIAIEHGLRFDERHLRAELDRAAALGGWTDAHFMTALQLAMRGDDGDAILQLIDGHRERAARLLPPEIAHGLEVEVLARKGRTGEARERLAAAAEALGPEPASRLELVIAEQEGANQVAVRLTAYEASGSETELHFLVQALAEADDDRTADYAIRLWRERRRTDDAALACRALFNAGSDAELDAFLDELGDVVETRPALREHAAWRLYRGGRLDEARTATDALRADAPDRPSLRQLAINIEIEGGDWHRLAPLVAQDLERREHRDAQQLLQAADIAHAAGNPIADDLARAAVEREPDDPSILVQAYTLAVRRGTDWGAEAGDWLRRAIAASGDDGPLQKGSLREVIRMRDEGQARAAELDRMILSGTLPITLAARPLGTTISELILARLAENVALPPRVRLCLPLVAGNRAPLDLGGAARIGLDPAAILALQLCGLLQETLDHAPGIVIPAGTLPLLLHDLEQAHRAQPARVEQAIRVKSLVDSGALRVLDEAAGNDDVAHLHRSAETLDARLVHTFPLHEPGSLGERERDPAPFVDRLSSPDAVVNALARRGEIPAQEAADALGRVSLLGGQGPGEPDIDLDRPLVLDGVAVNALEDCGLLDALVAAGVELHVDAHAVRIAEAEIAGQRRSTELERAIEAVRRTISSALASGKALLGPFRRNRRGENEASGRDLEMTPLVSLLQDGSPVDVLVSGDRMVNGHGHFTDAAGTSRPVASPLDVIDHLQRTGAIDAARRASARRKLREAGVALIPVEAEEVFEAAAAGDWSKGAPRPLRAIRNSIHLPIVRGAVSLPADRLWLENAVVAIAQAIRACWARLPDVVVAKTAADRLFAMIPVAAGLAAKESSDDARVWGVATTATMHALLATPMNVPADRLEAYHEWWAEVVAPRLEGRDLAALETVVDRVKLFLIMQEDLVEEVAGTKVNMAAVEVRRMIAGHLPPALLDRVTERADARRALGFEKDEVVIADRDVAVEALVTFLDDAFADSSATLVDSEGRPLATNPARREDGGITATIEGRSVGFGEAGLFANDTDMRLRTFERLTANRTLSPVRAARWRALLGSEKPTVETFTSLFTELNATAQAFVERVGAQNELAFGDLVATSPTYLGNLLDPELGDGSLPGALTALAEATAGTRHAASAIGASATLAVSPDLPLATMTEGMGDADVAALGVALSGEADPFSKLAGFAVLAGRARDATCREAATVALDRLLGEEGTIDASAELLAITATVALTALDQGALAGSPAAFRRTLAFAHAGHTCRALDRFNVDRAGLLAAARRWSANTWALGGALDRWDAPVWAREWLVPSAIAANVTRRAAMVIESVPVEERPDRWAEIVSARSGILATRGMGLGLRLPGPLDEFGNVRPVAAEDGGEAVEALDGASGEEADSLLFGFIWGCVPPADTTALEERALAHVDQAAGEGRATTAMIAIQVAARWRLTTLADGVADRVIGRRADLKLTVPVAVQLLVTASAALADGERTDTLGRYLRQLANSGLNQSEFAQLAGVIGLLENARPALAGGLEAIRSGALLGE